MTVESASQNVETNAGRPQPGSYRPAWLPELGVATVVVLLVYWLFLAFQVQGVDLNRTPDRWLAQVQAFPLLGFIPTPFATFFIEAFSPRVLRHVLVPGLLGYLLAGEAATGFVRSFYNFRSRAEAGSFLGRLQRHHSDRGPAWTGARANSSTRRPNAGRSITAHPDTGRPGIGRPAISRTVSGRTRLRPAIVLTLITLPFAGTFLLLVVFSAIMPPSPQRTAVYSALLVILSGLWFAIAGLYLLTLFTGGAAGSSGLLVQRDTLQQLRQEQSLLRVGGPGNIVVPNSDVIVTEYNGRFCRVLGPGVQKLLPFEYVRSMLDLRPHEREGDVTGITQDGVEVSCHVAVTFRLSNDDRYFSSEDAMNQVPQAETQRPTRERPYPYGEQAVRAAAYAEAVDGTGHVSSWPSLPLVIATGQFRNALAQNRLEVLFDPEADNREGNNDPAPHPELLQWMQDNTRNFLRKSGIELVTLRMGPLRPPEKVTAENLSGWRSYWEKQHRKREVEGRAAAVSTIEEARTQAEVDMLRAIFQGIQHARRESSAELVQEIVALRLVEALERAATTAEEHGEVLRRLEMLRRGLLPPEQPTD